MLKHHHKEARIQWANEHLLFGNKWLNVTFSDENKNGTSITLMGLIINDMISAKNLGA